MKCLGITSKKVKVGTWLLGIPVISNYGHILDNISGG
jgi:hypothetical protein